MNTHNLLLLFVVPNKTYLLRDVVIKKALKAEIAQLKSIQSITGGTIDSPPAISTSIPTDNTAIAQKLVSYQTFMEEYMVNAQNQKLLAIREAELKAEKKFQERLEKLLAASNAALREKSVDATVLSRELTLFEKRNARVIAAAQAGVSRWGSMEVERAQELAKNAPAVTSMPATSKSSAELTLFDQRNAKVVAAAAAGKSRWGDMEVNKAKNSGVTAVSQSSSSTNSQVAESSLFVQRNAKIVAAAAAGKSRWGSMEVDRAISSGASGTIVNVQSTTPAPSVVTLADRINLGAQLLGASTKVPAATQSASSAAQSTGSLFDQRNAKVVAAANAGKSRWGSMEVDKAKGSGISASSQSVTVGKESLFEQRNAKVVAAANAGRSRWGAMEVDRAKTGSKSANTPSLGGRVNVGAQLVGA